MNPEPSDPGAGAPVPGIANQTRSSELPEEAWLAALVSLPALGPARLATLLDGRSPRQAWHAVASNDQAVLGAIGRRNVVDRWPPACRATDVHALWRRYRELGIGVLGRDAAGYPQALTDDPEPPAVLFTQGDPAVVGRPSVGVVGTRQCTRYGIDLAFELGQLCARSGVTVVSGLAAGIDAAAHAGALSVDGAPPVAVVGTSLDSPYPRANGPLWRQVAATGLVCGETPLDAPAERWRFPARNRIIAGLSQVVVVIESHVRGGSLYTAAQAMERDRLVFAVPGPVRSPASMGCNRLLADGCMPLCDLDDVLVAVGLALAPGPVAEPVCVGEQAAAVLDAVGWQPATIDEVLAVVGGSLADLALEIEALLAAELLARRGVWVERTGRSAHVRGPNGPREPRTPGSWPRRP